MGLTWRDTAATVLVAAIVVPYAGYLIRGEMPLIESPQAMAGIALIIGLVAGTFGGTDMHTSDTVPRIAMGVGILSLTLGALAGVTGNQWLLAGFVGSIVLLWALATVRHAGWRRAARPGPAPTKAASTARSALRL